MMGIVLLVPAFLVAAPKDKALEDAERLCGQLKYVACLDALDKAMGVENKPRAALLRILELQGLTAAALNQSARSMGALRQLFVLDPNHTFPTTYSPRVNTRILEARGWARERGALTAVPAPDAGDTSKRIIEVVMEDPMSMVKEVRFHTRVPDGEWAVRLVPKGSKAYAVMVDGSSVEWWAQVVGERSAVLLEVGSANTPEVSRAKVAEVPRVEALTPIEKPQPPAPSTVEVAPTWVPRARFRPAAVTCLVLGAAAVGTGGYFAYSTAAARRTLLQPALDDRGRVLNRTQVQAANLNAVMQRDAWVADILFAAGTVAAATGITLFIAGSVKVEAGVSPGGAAVVVRTP